jgi:hypothetical protein
MSTSRTQQAYHGVHEARKGRHGLLRLAFLVSQDFSII